jgi:hypothetical protein
MAMALSMLPMPDGGLLVRGETALGRFEFRTDGQGRFPAGQVERLAPMQEPSPPARTTAARPCSGCGGARYDPRHYNRPGGSDELVQDIG